MPVLSEANVTTCTHPPERSYAWIVADPAGGRDSLCLGCTACGAVLSGASDMQGMPVGPQARVGPKKRAKRAKMTKAAKQREMVP